MKDSEKEKLLKDIDALLARLSDYRRSGLYQSESICIQLEWCKDRLSGKLDEAAPGPLTMGLIATREFDMWGSEPELAEEVNRIEKLAHRALKVPRW